MFLASLIILDTVDSVCCLLVDACSLFLLALAVFRYCVIKVVHCWLSLDSCCLLFVAYLLLVVVCFVLSAQQRNFGGPTVFGRGEDMRFMKYVHCADFSRGRSLPYFAHGSCVGVTWYSCSGSLQR